MALNPGLGLPSAGPLLPPLLLCCLLLCLAPDSHHSICPVPVPCEPCEAGGLAGVPEPAAPPRGMCSGWEPRSLLQGRLRWWTIGHVMGQERRLFRRRAFSGASQAQDDTVLRLRSASLSLACGPTSTVDGSWFQAPHLPQTLPRVPGVHSSAAHLGAQARTAQPQHAHAAPLSHRGRSWESWVQALPAAPACCGNPGKDLCLLGLVSTSVRQEG